LIVIEAILIVIGGLHELLIGIPIPF